MKIIFKLNICVYKITMYRLCDYKTMINYFVIKTNLILYWFNFYLKFLTFVLRVKMVIKPKFELLNTKYCCFYDTVVANMYLIF